MRLKKMSVGVTAALIGAAAIIIVAVIQGFFEHSTPTNRQIVTASGSNITQQVAGGNVYNGASDETLQKVLGLKDTELMERMLEEFPYGGIVVGFKDNKIMWQKRLKDIKVEFDPDSIKFFAKDGVAYLTFSNYSVTNSITGGAEKNVGFKDFMFRLPPVGQPVHCEALHVKGCPDPYFKLLDADRSIFIIGFR